ncbi:MAG: hypothetical protein PVJ67_04250 [Candidatus Pacearchaeota archaeon]|jgi:hypothetical protein
MKIIRYIGDVEIYIPDFKRIINKGDLVPEMSEKEAHARKDFIVERIKLKNKRRKTKRRRK